MAYKRVHIDLYNDTGNIQSSGSVTITDDKRVHLGKWLFGGKHALRRPIGAIRRITNDWVADGGDRDYSGFDEQTEMQFRASPEA